MESHKRNVDQELSNYMTRPEFDFDKNAVLHSPWNVNIWDINQQIFILRNNRLVADLPNYSLSGHVMEVAPNLILDSEKQPIFMGLKNTSKILSCVKSLEGLPQLQLVTGDIMGLYNRHEESLEFTFYTHTKGSPTTCYFESAAFPEWFLSTSPEPNKPIGLSQQGGSDIILFYFKRKWDYE